MCPHGVQPYLITFLFRNHVRKRNTFKWLQTVSRSRKSLGINWFSNKIAVNRKHPMTRKQLQ